jgi:hypothetical protein
MKASTQSFRNNDLKGCSGANPPLAVSPEGGRKWLDRCNPPSFTAPCRPILVDQARTGPNWSNEYIL